MSRSLARRTPAFTKRACGRHFNGHLGAGGSRWRRSTQPARVYDLLLSHSEVRRAFRAATNDAAAGANAAAANPDAEWTIDDAKRAQYTGLFHKLCGEAGSAW